MRPGMRLANSRGVTAVHDKDGWLGALALFRSCTPRERSHCACGSRSRTSRVDRDQRGSASPGSATTCSARLHQGLHGRDAGVADRARLDGSGVEITSARRARGHRAPRPRGRASRRRPRDRGSANREAFDARGARESGDRAGCAPASSTRSSWPLKTCRASPRSASPPPCSSATRRRPRPRRPLWAG